MLDATSPLPRVRPPLGDGLDRGGWSLEDSVWLSTRLKEIGIDLVDCSSGGLVPNASINVEPGYQVPFAEEVRRRLVSPPPLSAS